MNEYAKMIIILVIISIVAGATLAFSYEITNPMIEKQAQIALEESVLKVIPGAKTMEEEIKDDITIYIGIDEKGDKKGLAFKGVGSGFDGPIEMMIGYDPKEGKLTGVEILSMSETPGLGANIKEEDFISQFVGKTHEDKFIVNEDIDSITGATISSAAVANAVKDALSKVTEIYPVGGDF